MFSILVSELTPALLAKAEYWRFMQVHPSSAEIMAETLPVSRIQLDTSLVGWNRVFRLQMETEEEWVYYDSDVRCFPVTLSPDGTEVRLEMPQMPDEPLIEWYPKPSPNARYNAIGAAQTPHGAKHWRLEGQTIPFTSTATQMAPTSEHSPRLTLDGEWVWSTRR